MEKYKITLELEQLEARLAPTIASANGCVQWDWPAHPGGLVPHDL